MGNPDDLMKNISFKMAVAVLMALAGQAQAADLGASDWSAGESGKIRLIAAATATGDAASLKFGLHFQMAPGWKIYWRSPGDAGYPPKIDWSRSDNLGTPVISWPAPKRFQLAGLQNHGYSGEVVLPLDVPVLQPGRAARLAADVDYLACAQICVPMQAALRLDLPSGPAQPSAFVHDLGRFAALVPGDGARHGLTVDKLEAIGAGDQTVLRLSVSADTPFNHPDMFVEPAESASFEAPTVTVSADGTRAILESAVVPGTVQRPLTDGALTITLVDGIRALETSLTPVPGSAAAPEASDTLAAMVLVAVLGGLILNLMPCVLPVLSIKVLGALSHGGAERGHVRAAFLASAAGIVVSFLALAAAAVAVKAAGQAVGWGIQFQQPVFLAVMMTLLVLFAANLWGIFDIRLPSALMNVGAGGIAHHTLLGHFLSGAFATLLATPCSAPFLGTALGFALARGPAEITAIFAALGLGMSAPYLAMAAWPDLARRLPKPGAWMVTAKKIMGVALAATALWLGTILATQTGLWSGAVPATADTARIAWTKFDEAALKQAVSEGRVVFVDVTADWCITCKVNKAATIERGEVAKRLTGGAVTAMRADWTKPDDSIARYLASFNRYGIPFNAVYGPGAPNGLALSELLSEAEVLAALDKAAAR